MPKSTLNLAEALEDAQEAINPKANGAAIAWGSYGKAIANGRNGIAVARGMHSTATAIGPNGKAMGVHSTKLTLAYWAGGKKLGEKTGLVVSSAELHKVADKMDTPSASYLRAWTVYRLNSELQFEEVK